MVSETWQLTNPILTFMDVFFWHYFFKEDLQYCPSRKYSYMQMMRTQFNMAKQRVQRVLDWKYPNWIFNQSVDCQILIMACWSCNFQKNAKVANPCLKIRKSWIYMYCTLGKFDSGWQSRSTNSIVMTTQFSTPVWLKVCWDSQERLDIYISWVYNPFKLNYGY